MPYNGIPYSVLDTRYLRLNCSNDPLTAGLEVNAATTGEPVLILQTTDDNATFPVLEIQNAAGAMLSEIEKDGNLNFATATAANPGMIELNDNRFVHTYGTDNLFIGDRSGNFTLTGQGNVGLGPFTLDALTSGNFNLGIGAFALSACTSAAGNVAVGVSALISNTTGDTNVALGGSALGDNTIGQQGIAVGNSALRRNVDGNNNVAIGVSALSTNVSGGNNFALGFIALLVSTGDENIAIGTGCLRGNTTGDQNIGIGGETGRYQEEGSHNTLVGYQAGRGTGAHNKSDNVMIGYWAGFLTQTADNNILIGYKAGDVLTTGDSNIIIGYDIDPSAADASSELNIGDIIFGDLTVPDVRLGDLATNHFKVDNVGDVVFVGGSGLVFGSCYGNHIAWVQAAAVQNTWYNISDADMISGPLHNVTHDGNGMLTVTEPGMYVIIHCVCFEDDTANDHIETGIEINSSGAAVAAGQCHVENKFANEEEHLGGGTILDLADNSTIEMCIRTTDAGTPDITVHAVNLSVVQVGGT